jgi:hypothetical protein
MIVDIYYQLSHNKCTIINDTSAHEIMHFGIGPLKNGRVVLDVHGRKPPHQKFKVTDGSTYDTICAAYMLINNTSELSDLLGALAENQLLVYLQIHRKKILHNIVGNDICNIILGYI